MLGGLGKGSRMSEITKQNCRKSAEESYKRDPTYRKRVSDGVNRALRNDPTIVRKQSESAKKRWQIPAKREEVSRKMKEYLRHPENCAFINSDKRPKAVRCVETGEVYPSQNAAERTTGLCGIHRACEGWQKTTGGYHWEYIA